MLYDAELYIVLHDGRDLVVSNFQVYHWLQNQKELATAILLPDILLSLVPRTSLGLIKDIIINDVSDPDNPIPVASYSEFYDNVEFNKFPYEWKDSIGRQHRDSNFRYTWNQIKNLNEAIINRDIPGVEADDKYFKDKMFYLELSPGWIRWITTGRDEFILGMSNFFHNVNLDAIYDFIMEGR